MSGHIAEAKANLPLPGLLYRLGLGEHAKKSALCPFHPDKHNSFSTWKSEKGFFWKCHAGCGQGDEITFLEKHEGLSNGQAITRYLQLAGVNGSKPLDTAFKKAKAVMSKDWQPEPKPVSASQPFDWQKCIDAFTAEHQEELCDWRGFSPEFVSWLCKEKLIGLYEGLIAFPVHKGGHIVGAHVRQKDGKKWFHEPKGTSAAPFLIGEIEESTLHVFESTWDALAFMSVSGERSGVICTRGASNAKSAVEAAAKASTLYLWTQNDEPGEKWQADIVAGTQCTVKRCKVPAPHKDLNDWTRAGATVDELLAAMLNAEVLREAEKSWTEALSESVVTSRELAALALTPRQKLLADWFCEGDCGFIFAFRGVGKTWLALAIARALSTAGKLGEWEAPRRVKVLYVDGEMPPDLMRDRAQGLERGNDQLEFLNHLILFERTGRVLNIADREVQQALTTHCVANNVKVLVLDNLSTLASGMKENEADSWEKLNPWLLDLRRRKIAVVIVHHAGRSGEMRGTSKREDNVFWIIALDDMKKNADDKRGARFISHFTKPSRNTQEEVPAYQWHFVTEANGNVSISHKQAQTLDVFLQIVRDGVTENKQIAAEMKLPDYVVSRLAKKAMDAGKLRKRGRNYELIEIEKEAGK